MYSLYLEDLKNQNNLKNKEYQDCLLDYLKLFNFIFLCDENKPVDNKIVPLIKQ